MNLLERNTKTTDEPEQSWREDMRDAKQDSDAEKRREDERKSEPEINKRERKEGRLVELAGKPYVTAVLLGVIVVLLLCIVVLLVMPRFGKKDQMSSADKLQQNITDYAQEQKDTAQKESEDSRPIIIKQQEIEPSAGKDETDKAAQEATPEAEDTDKTAIVVDVEDESDVSYSKEYILNEALPYFQDNNQDAIWDLAHLKRYVKLSGELKNTGSYYYTGDVNTDGTPHGNGLAIYEDNCYYYGQWENGVRSGEGRWFHFYIGVKDQSNAMGKYMAHSYSGSWKNNLPDGSGSEHYDVDLSRLAVRERILQNVVGNFSAGLYDGDLFANTVDYTGTEEEWYGSAKQGVFDLFRDVSAIGECSVWQNKADPSLCLDIDESENKRQGIRELLK